MTISLSSPAFELFTQIGMTSSETTKTKFRTKFSEEDTLTRHSLKRRDVKLQNLEAAILFRRVRNVPSAVLLFLCGVIKLKLSRPGHEGTHP